MFTHGEWRWFCQHISQMGVPILPVCEAFPLIVNGQQVVVLKHDVEHSLGKALDIALIEAQSDIRSTYYVHVDALSTASNVRLLQKINALGHEIGYHYDALDRANGNFTAAFHEFRSSLTLFQNNGFTIQTVCPHGNPALERHGWGSNADLLRNSDYRVKLKVIDVIVDVIEPGLSGVIFISDAGYSWNRGEIAGLDGVISLIEVGKPVCISTHPHRWSKWRIVPILRRDLFLVIRFAAQTLYRTALGRRLLSGLYYVQRRV